MRRGVLTLALLSAWLVYAAPVAAQDSEEKPWVASAGIGGSFGTLGSYGGGLENLAVEVMGGRSISPLIAIVGEMGGALHAPQDKAKPFVSTDFSYIAPAALARPSTIHINGLHWNANVWITPQLNVPRFQPYVTAGYGGYTGSAVRETDFGLVHNNVNTSPAGNAGGGVMVAVYRFVSVRADYRAYFINSDDSVTLNQFSLTVGVGGRR
jgi:hypothetical protein